jgi:hypothetical protein
MHSLAPDARNATGYGFLEHQIPAFSFDLCGFSSIPSGTVFCSLKPDTYANNVVESGVETVTLGGDRWRSVGEYPRLIAESFRRLLERYGVPSMLRTPFQWVQSTPVIEIETGGYMGMVQMFVPESMYDDAMHVLEGQVTDAEAHELDEMADAHADDFSSKP